MPLRHSFAGEILTLKIASRWHRFRKGALGWKRSRSNQSLQTNSIPPRKQAGTKSRRLRHSHGRNLHLDPKQQEDHFISTQTQLHNPSPPPHHLPALRPHSPLKRRPTILQQTHLFPYHHHPRTHNPQIPTPRPLPPLPRHRLLSPRRHPSRRHHVPPPRLHHAPIPLPPRLLPHNSLQRPRHPTPQPHRLEPLPRALRPNPRIHIQEPRQHTHDR